jgi:hypothetical protein
MADDARRDEARSSASIVDALGEVVSVLCQSADLVPSDLDPLQ